MKTYVDIHAHVGLYGAFWIYSGVSVVGLFFVCCVVPETKGVELEEMEHHSVVQTSATQALNPNSPPNATTITSCTPAPSSASSNLVSNSNKAFLPSTKDNYYPPPLQTPPGAKLSPRPQLHLNLKMNSFVRSNLPEHLQPSENMPLQQYRHPGRLMMMTQLGPTQSMPYETMQHDEMEEEFSHLPPSLDYSHHHRYVDPYYYRHAQSQQLPPSRLSPYNHHQPRHQDYGAEAPFLYADRSSLYMPPHVEQAYNSEEEMEYGIFPYSSRITTGPFRPKRGTVV